MVRIVDEVGYWSEIKLAIVREYAAAYVKILGKQSAVRRYAYVDAFAGSGVSISRRNRLLIRGSPLNALQLTPPFTEYHFIDLDGSRTEMLRRHVGDRKEVFVHDGDCNEVLMNAVFPRCRWEDYARALVLLDPYRLGLKWSVLEAAGKMRSVEVFFNFMIMDANRNILWRHPEKVPEKQKRKMDEAWGDRSWADVAYRSVPGLFDEMKEKSDNETIVEALRKRLQEKAGFQFVPIPIPMRNSRNVPVYYLFFAAQKAVAGHIVSEIFAKYRNRGAETWR